MTYLTLPKFSLSTDGLFAIVPNQCYPNKIDEKIWKEFEDFDNEECVCFISPFYLFLIDVYTHSKVFLTNLDAFTWQYEVDDLLMRYGLEPFSIEVDHPIVSAIGNFAVKAFNKACEMVCFPSTSFYPPPFFFRGYKQTNLCLLLAC